MTKFKQKINLVIDEMRDNNHLDINWYGQELVTVKKQQRRFEVLQSRTRIDELQTVCLLLVSDRRKQSWEQVLHRVMAAASMSVLVPERKI